MAENGTEAGAEAQPPGPPKMSVMTQFIRDLSFENILAQKGVSGEVAPEVAVNIAVEPRNRTVENQYEVAIKLNVESKNKGTEEKLFILEIDYAGVFAVENVPQDQLHPYLMIECPRMIFPFLRRVVHDVTRDGGFPPLNLENVDFIQLYRNELAKRAAEAQAQKADA